MRVLVLVIVSFDKPVYYDMLRVWKERVLNNRFVSVDVWFIFYDIHICNWLLKETASKQYIENIYNVSENDIFFSFIIFTLSDIISFIQKQYNIIEHTNFNVISINILKIDNNYNKKIIHFLRLSLH